jgi:hypothetical protein
MTTKMRRRVEAMVRHVWDQTGNDLLNAVGKDDLTQIEVAEVVADYVELHGKPFDAEAFAVYEQLPWHQQLAIRRDAFAEHQTWGR